MGAVDQLSEQVRGFARRVEESGAGGLAGLYDLTAQRLLRFAVTITRNQHDAEDALQAALVRFASEPGAILRATRPWPYLLQMVRNEALVTLRKKKRITPLNNILDLLTRRSVDEVELEETHRAVWLALRMLPLEQSEVVVLKIWEDMTFAEVSEVLGIPPATAASRYRYALQKLARRLESDFVEACDE